MISDTLFIRIIASRTDLEGRNLARNVGSTFSIRYSRLFLVHVRILISPIQRRVKKNRIHRI